MIITDTTEDFSIHRKREKLGRVHLEDEKVTRGVRIRGIAACCPHNVLASLYSWPTTDLAQRSDYGVSGLRVTAWKRDDFRHTVWGRLKANLDGLCLAKVVRRLGQMAGSAATHIPRGAALSCICKDGTIDINILSVPVHVSWWNYAWFSVRERPRLRMHTPHACGGQCAGNCLQTYSERYMMRCNSRSRPDKAKKRVMKCLLRISFCTIASRRTFSWAFSNPRHMNTNCKLPRQDLRTKALTIASKRGPLYWSPPQCQREKGDRLHSFIGWWQRVQGVQNHTEFPLSCDTLSHVVVIPSCHCYAVPRGATWNSLDAISLARYTKMLYIL